MSRVPDSVSSLAISPTPQTSPGISNSEAPMYELSPPPPNQLAISAKNFRNDMIVEPTSQRSLLNSSSHQDDNGEGTRYNGSRQTFNPLASGSHRKVEEVSLISAHVFIILTIFSKDRFQLQFLQA